MTGDHRTGQPVVVRAGPPEVCGRRADHDGGVGDPARHHDVGPGIKAVDDAPGPEVGVRGQRGAQSQLGSPRQQVVTLDVGHRHVHPESVGQCPDRVGQTRRVEAAGVGDDAHAPVLGQAQALLQLGQEGLGVTPVGALHPVAAEDEHGQFGQVVPGQIVQFAAGEHLPHRGVPVAVEA